MHLDVTTIRHFEKIAALAPLVIWIIVWTIIWINIWTEIKTQKKKERGQYPASMTEKAWSVTHIYIFGGRNR